MYATALAKQQSIYMKFTIINMQSCSIVPALHITGLTCPYQGGGLHKRVQLGVAELQTDDIQHLLPRL